MNSRRTAETRDRRFAELDRLIALGLGDKPSMQECEARGTHFWVPHGHSRDRRRREICKICHRTRVLGPSAQDEQHIRIVDALLVPGSTIRSVAAQLRCSQCTVALYAKQLRGVRPACPCGRSAGHKG